MNNYLVLQFAKMKIFLLLFLCYISSNAQIKEQIIEYTPTTKKINAWDLPIYDTILSNSVSESYIPSNLRITDLPSDFPFYQTPDYKNTQNVIARSILNVSDFPLSAVVRLSSNATGIMISPNLVLTSSYSFKLLKKWEDTIVVYPAYDNHKPNVIFDSSVAIRYYSLGNLNNLDYMAEFGIIELKEPLGYKTGWVSVAFQEESSYYFQNSFHTFTYPVWPKEFPDSNNVNDPFNLFYDFLKIKNLAYRYFEVYDIHTEYSIGAPFLSLFESNFTVHGIRVYMANSGFIRINKKEFYWIKSLINEKYPNGTVKTTENDLIKVRIIKSDDYSYILMESKNNEKVDLLFVNYLGQIISSQNLALENGSEKRVNIPAGLDVLFLILKSEKGIQKYSLLR